MPSRRLYLVRHGRAAASFAEAVDPGLDETGRAQAEAMAARLAPLGPLPIVTSPLRRTRETAAPLERRWSQAARLEPAVAEIPAPFDSPARRGEWLRGVIGARWPDLDAGLGAWRASVLEALAALPGPTVVVSHYVAINVAVGHALGDDRVITFSPENCSVTVIDVDGAAFCLVERGAEGAARLTAG